MLDKDLTFLYQVETGVLNRAVKRNIKRFPESYSFEVTICDLKERIMKEK